MYSFRVYLLDIIKNLINFIEHLRCRQFAFGFYFIASKFDSNMSDTTRACKNNNFFLIKLIVLPYERFIY